ncbi:hypothetical protein CQ14_35930 [Bradyrhizobium lablabi]|uniref:Uncharacterized protein n=1 Tax=Bradyrhizobium lablabi TaxID=722472 RepID=A0A0R3N2N6_9BRAD|nr:hypothetical protein CQ14_35930 [Bradyrhizobium lablabi]
MIEVKQHHQWPDTKLPCALCDARQEQIRRWTSTMRRTVVLCHVICKEAESVVRLCQDEPICVLLGDVAAVLV